MNPEKQKLFNLITQIGHDPELKNALQRALDFDELEYQQDIQQQHIHSLSKQVRDLEGDSDLIM